MNYKKIKKLLKKYYKLQGLSGLRLQLNIQIDAAMDDVRGFMVNLTPQRPIHVNDLYFRGLDEVLDPIEVEINDILASLPATEGK